MIRRNETNVVSHEKFKAKPNQNIFISLQKWEGIVMDVMDDAFLARLIDLTQKGTDEEAEFSFDEISEEDKPLIRSGAIFYWNIGYSTVVFCHSWRQCDTLRPYPILWVKG